MKKLFFLGIVLLVGVLIAGILRFTPTPKADTSQARIHPAQPVTLNGKALALEVVTSTEDEQQGLGDRESMPQDHGMLFLFDPAGPYAFWMRHMQFPLDIIWLNDNRVVTIAAGLPAPKHLTDVPVIHKPAGSADMVLELNAGGAERYGLKVGDIVTWEGLVR